MAFFLAFAVAAAQLVVADAPAADEGEVFARAHHEFAVSAGFVQGLFAEAARKSFGAAARVAEDVGVGQAAKGAVVGFAAQRQRPALLVFGFEVVVVGADDVFAAHAAPVEGLAVAGVEGERVLFDVGAKAGRGDL